MSKSEALQRIRENNKQNDEKLKNCPGHYFIKSEGLHNYIPKYVCQRCGGVVEETAKIYYELGRSHGAHFN